jgi:RHS repeat-associated protein
VGKQSRLRRERKTQEHIPTTQSDVEPQSLGGVGGAGGTTTYYIHGPRGIHAQQSDADNIWKWMAQDGLNTVRSVVDNGTNILESITLDPYGNPIDASGSPQTEYGFTGEPTDPNELVYLRNRYYNPSLGTFISQDPVEGSMNNPMSLNRYAYVQGNPVNKTDPSGLAPNMPFVPQFAQMIYTDPLRFANMMNSGVCLAQVPTGTPTPTSTPVPGTVSAPQDFYVNCDLRDPLNIRQSPSRLAPVVAIINNPAGVQLQVSNTYVADAYLGGTRWFFVPSFGGWVYDGFLTQGISPCPNPGSFVTPTPLPPTTTPGPNDLDTISRVIACEAASAPSGAYGIAHSIYNRMTSPEWANYPTALDVIRYTGVDCFTQNRHQSYPRTIYSDAAARWLLGMGPTPQLNNESIDLRGYYWLGIPNDLGIPLVPGTSQEIDAVLEYILNHPDDYVYSQCSPNNESREIRKQRLQERFVALDPSEPSESQYRTVYFSRSPLCDQ